jgi:hypothetical protein
MNKICVNFFIVDSIEGVARLAFPHKDFPFGSQGFDHVLCGFEQGQTRSPWDRENIICEQFNVQT